MAKILVVEDEAAIRRGLVEVLEAKGHEVDTAATGTDGLAKATDRERVPDLVLLDVMLPGMGGFDVLRRIRDVAPGLPIIMLTAKGQEVDRVRGFELGVDDYVVKPFSVMELLGRVAAVLRRSNGPAAIEPELVVAIGLATVDFDRMTLVREGASRELAAKGFDLLRCLLRHKGKVVSRDTIMDEVWGQDSVLNTRTIDNYVVKIRQLVEPDPNNPRHLHTVHGAGYRLDL
ncbi:MAG: response regulator transcription factor [Candidatus Sericytochromatia bacterium]|nr:response regulator transcription factor [Candidatus Tanganyikabacteria bacterium]